MSINNENNVVDTKVAKASKPTAKVAKVKANMPNLADLSKQIQAAIANQPKPEPGVNLSAKNSKALQSLIGKLLKDNIKTATDAVLAGVAEWSASITTTQPPNGGGGGRKAPVVARKAGVRDSRLPAAGTVLSREYHGTTYQATVLENGGVQIGEVVYPSISAAARSVNGLATCNGFDWFAQSLNAARAATVAPVAA